MAQKTAIDNTVYDALGERWYTAQDDPIALLRAESRLLGPWVLEAIRTQFDQHPVRVLDVGCGAGFLTNRLAKAELSVTGLDLSQQSLAVAAQFDETGSVNYLSGDANALPFDDAAFEVVTCMDFLEHVDEPKRVIAEASRVLKPGGLFLFHTFNRNFIARVMVIHMVETLVKNTPKNLHVYELFSTPQEIDGYCQDAGMVTSDWRGTKPVLAKLSVLKGLFTREVPEDFEFRFTTSLKVAYVAQAIKS